MAEKSILEQALLQIENLEEAVKQNAKGILGSVVKQELNGLLKESMKEEGDVTDEDNSNVDEDDEELSKNIDDETSEDDEDDMGTDDEETSDSVDGIESSDDMSNDDMDDTSDDEDDTMPSDDTVMDMTNASDDEVVKVFKAMKPNDGIVVKRDGNNLDINIDGDEYVIKLDEVPGEDMSEEMDEDMYEEMDMEEETMDSEEETVYEIELDGSDEETPTETKESKIEKPFKAAKGAKKIEATEAARTQGNDVRGEGPRQGKKFKAGRPELNEEVSKLRKQNDEYKKALVLFKEKLNEVAVFNASLAYATRLFTEHSTTKQEKLNILKRFDSVSTMNESKTLYSSIKSELNSKKPVTESVADKISATPKSSSSKEVLAEAKAYENPQFKRMKELMAKIK
jgi:hypothetical protein